MANLSKYHWSTFSVWHDMCYRKHDRKKKENDNEQKKTTINKKKIFRNEKLSFENVFGVHFYVIF